MIVRCDPETKRRFRALLARGGFRNYEDCLKWLLMKAETEWVAERVY
jgi:hypothetical protein